MGVRMTAFVRARSSSSNLPPPIARHVQSSTPSDGDAIASGVKAIMTGPSPIDVVDPGEPASTSEVIVHKLRADLSFSGLIISDDVDLRGTLRGRMVPEVAVKALKAGVELLLLAGGPQVEDVVARIIEAVETGKLPEAALKVAASKVTAELA
jgi:beta-N-acetylhexosaminidase